MAVPDHDQTARRELATRDTRVGRAVVYLAVAACTVLLIWALIEGGERNLWTGVSALVPRFDLFVGPR